MLTLAAVLLVLAWIGRQMFRENRAQYRAMARPYDWTTDRGLLLVFDIESRLPVYTDSDGNGVWFK